MNDARCTMHKEGKDGYFMDRQYEYVSSGDSGYHGFLSDHPGECPDQVAEERMKELQIADFRFQIEKSLPAAGR